MIKALGGALLLGASLLGTLAFADTGVLIPRDKDAPDPSIISITELRVDVRIDNGDARVRMVEIFTNHTNGIQEGTFQFALPDGSTVSDFAVWDGAVRIPAVVLERKRAEEIYIRARAQAIDPGLLEMGERTDDPATTTSLFTAKISPIPAYGTKRVELEYHQRIAVNSFKQVFVLHLKPDAYGKQTTAHTSLHFELESAHAVQGFALVSQLFPLQFSHNDAHTVTGGFEGDQVALNEDFVARWQLAETDADALDVIAFRSQKAPLPQLDETSPQAPQVEPGFFAAQMLIGNVAAPQANNNVSPQTVILLFDNSLSMQWDKLERSYAAFEAVLHTLRSSDHFNVLPFNQDVTEWKSVPVAADAAAVVAARDYVRSSKLRGGTDIGKALAAGLKQCDAENCTLLLLTDGGSDRGASILPGKIAMAYASAWKASLHQPRTAIFAVGDDAHLDLLKLLARNNGLMEHVTSTEPVEYKIEAFLSKLSHHPVSGMKLETAPDLTRMVYPLDQDVFTGSMATWVGQYTRPAKNVRFTASAVREGRPFTAGTSVDLPETAEEHVQLPRLWAQARVDALLAQIAAEGESRAAIDEIIRLSRRYKFVTPYTSFLAVPRSLLRPRVIRPGDPVLRVRTDPAIESVIALFPFGLNKPLRHLADEDTTGLEGGKLWETRFLAPPEMKDGTYSVRLLLRDVHGNTYRENKTFVIASSPPVVKLQMVNHTLHRGELVELRAQASSSTRTLTARLSGPAYASLPVTLRWTPAVSLDTGKLPVPADLPAGRYTLVLTAEDIAHNLSTEEVTVDVLP